MTSRIAVLASGGGTNLQALLDHFAALGHARPADVVLVASDRASAGAIERAKVRHIPTAIVAPRTGAAGEPVDATLDAHRIDLIVLAGYLRLVPEATVDRYRGRIVNVHPALLPAFGGEGMYGSRVHEAVLDSGATVSGVTVHFVEHAYDRGPVIAQWPVPVFPDDTAAALGARVLNVEHILYPLAVGAVAAGDVSLGDDGKVRRRRIHTASPTAADAWAFSLSPSSGPRLANEIARAIGG
jgi:formyltetrahydrofolate-dependent phosphoribosylglycinamide formyltransferase